MTDVPENWYRVTPALAGRITNRGLPPPVIYIAGATFFLFGFAYRSTFSALIGNNALGLLASFAVGALIGTAICLAVLPLGKKDRDWLAIMGDWYAIQFRLMALKAWEWIYRW